MPDLLRVTFVLVLVLGMGGVALWLLPDSETSPPTEQPIEGLSDRVSIEWSEEGPVEIEASETMDAFAALGYVHGMNHGWTVALWRRTARGTLSEWFGEKTVSLDRHSRRLGFARSARKAYDSLPPSDQQRLESYSRGMTAALHSQRVHNLDPFLVLGETPNSWEPWHTLAVQRLLAWIATDPATVESSSEKQRTSFGATDRLLRRWLQLHGWNRSITWAARPSNDTARTLLFSRHVLGATAEPVMQEVALHGSESTSIMAATVPGTFLFPTGTTGTQAWTRLLSSPATVEHVPLDTTQLRQWYERISPSNSDEQIFRVRRHGDHLLLNIRTAPPPSPSRDTTARVQADPSDSVTVAPDTAVVLTWPGLSTRSDISAWTQLLPAQDASAEMVSDTASFYLFRNEGLDVDSSGQWTVRGRPPVVENRRENGFVLLGRASWAHYQAQSLNALQQTSSPDGNRWSTSDSSTWAASLLPDLLPDVAIYSSGSPYAEGLSYLQNWDYKYESSSIGAAVFDHWMREYRHEIGHLPTAPDTTYLAAPRRRSTFREAIDTLVARYGSDVRRWRWERIAPDRRHFPMWAADSLVAADLEELSNTQYAPLDRPGRGHASSLAGGPSLVNTPPLGPAPTAWEGWMRSDQQSLTVRRLRFDPTAFFARPLMSVERPSPVSLQQTETTSTTSLVPHQP